jgi:hypothetical protein
MSAKGKIARLSFELRQKLNQRMRDGDPDVDLVEWLNGLQEVKAALSGASFGGRMKTRAQITAQNLSEYRKGGYQDWLDNQDKVDRAHKLAELSYELASASGGNVSETIVRVTAGRIYEALELATGDDLCKLTAALTGLSAAETAAVRATTDKDRLRIQEKTLSLEEAKFQRQTAELFLKFYSDKRAQEIAEGKGTKSVKIDQLRQMMFGEINHGNSAPIPA